MASKYLITKNVLAEYDEYILHKNIECDMDRLPFKEWIYNKLGEIDTKRKEESAKKLPKKLFKEFIQLHQYEYEKLIEEYGYTKVQDIISRMNDYIGSKGDKYKSHYHTILSWFNQKGVKKIDKKPDTIPLISEPKKELTEEQKQSMRDSLTKFRDKLKF